jgi:hypothetical protein
MSSSNQLYPSLGQTMCLAIPRSETLLIPLGFSGIIKVSKSNVVLSYRPDPKQMQESINSNHKPYP